jgi:hypothetical protein
MAKCDYCGTTIIFGGIRNGNFRFCNEKCFQNGTLAQLANQVPPDLLQQETVEVHAGKCPKCKGNEPVDVHTSHCVWSIIVMTRWSSKPQVSCRKCAVKSHLGNALFSFVCGWWGFPWGLIITPVQVVRNIIGIFRGPNPSKPSPQLEKLVRIQLAARMVAYQKAQQQPTPLPEQSPV